MTSRTEPGKPKPHWREVKLRRVALALVLVFAGSATLAVLYFAALSYFGPYIAVHDLARGEPIAWAVSTPLPDTAIASLAGERVEEFGYSIQLPWPNIPPPKSRAENMDLVCFRNGAAAIFENPANQIVSLLDLTRGSKEAQAELSRLMGADTAQSDYAMLNAAFSMTPDQVHWWTPRRRAARAVILMQAKLFQPGEARSIHPIHGPQARGFQLGDPGDKEVRLTLFDEHDRCYGITLYSNGLYTQPQINAIVASFQPHP
jgi:hypothetical protein